MFPIFFKFNNFFYNKKKIKLSEEVIYTKVDHEDFIKLLK